MMPPFTLPESLAVYHGIVGQAFAREYVCELALVLAVNACVMGLRRFIGAPDLRG